ncbi:MAG: histidine phosphatase family protein [Defluviitaleaceae bacterium]|nr:histidine phosphatase family protein [Defluviitaleaceae bacterium]
MKIYTARHGQTGWNAEGRMQGLIDIPLDETGLAQAEKLAERFKNVRITRIYSSSLSRAYETAKTINKHHNVEIITEDGLREISYGEFEGRLLSEIGKEFSIRQETGRAMPGGEEFDDFFARVHSCLDKIMADNNEDLLIVGHAGTVRAALAYFLKLPMEQFTSFGIGNTAVHCFELCGNTGSFSMVIENDTSHL